MVKALGSELRDHFDLVVFPNSSNEPGSAQNYGIHLKALKSKDDLQDLSESEQFLDQDQKESDRGRY
jgi:hypothetical protein